MAGGSWLRAPLAGALLVAAAAFGAGLAQGDLRIDGALYGWVARRMVLTGDWLNMYLDGGETDTDD